MLRFLRHLFHGKPSAPSAPADPIDYRTLTEGSSDVIMRCAKNGTPYYVSPSCLELFGWTPEEMVGKPPMHFILPEDMPGILAAQASHNTDLLSYRVRRKDGTVVWVETNARVVTDAATGVRDVVIVTRDITARRQLEEQLSKLAMTDGLTGLANRRAFDERFANEWLRTIRANGEISLLLIDLDHFKGFNDQYGHQVGDDCLRAVASAISTTVRRPADLAARYGGEEMTVILPDTNLAGAIEVAEGIRAAVAGLRIPHAQNYGTGIVTVSIGAATALSTVGASMQMPAGLLQAADIALYKAKANGRNRVETALLLSGGGQVTAAA